LRVIHGRDARALPGENNEMSIGTIVMLAVSLLLLIYLTFALLRPEKF
jgi:K+-transporting ATPase KdpF subunit